MAVFDVIDRRAWRAAAKAPFLTREEEKALALRWKHAQDQDAMHQLTIAHMRLVIAVATKFRHYGLSMPDLMQEGHIGLLEAAARFEPERDVRFSTYANWWIRASIQDYVLKNWSIVRGGTSSGQKALFFNLRKLRAKLTRDGARLSAEVNRMIADALGVGIRDVQAMEARLTQPDLSLNTPVTDEGDSAEIQDFLADERADLAESVMASRLDSDRRHWVREALLVLNERERLIISVRKLADEERTLDDLGQQLGISKERVRQIESRAMEKLRAALLQQQPDVAAFF